MMFIMPHIYNYARGLCAMAALVVLAVCLVPATARAQMIDEPIDENIEIIQPRELNISLIRSGDNSGEAILRLITPVALSGCPTIGPIQTDMMVNSSYLDIAIKGFTLDKNDMAAHQRDCGTARQYAYTDLPIDRALLHGNEIREIRFNLRGTADYYDVDLTAERLQLLPRRQMRVKPAGNADSPTGGLTFWYYPEGTIILSLPAAPAGSNVVRDLNSFAAAQGLQRLDKLMPAFANVAGKNDQAYYVDQASAFAKVNSATPQAIGTLNHGGKTVDVYGRRPNMNE